MNNNWNVTDQFADFLATFCPNVRINTTETEIQLIPDGNSDSVYTIATKPTIPNDSLPEFVGQVIDVFEDFLEDRHISIQNEEREEDPDAAILYGTDYGELQSGIEAILSNWGLSEVSNPPRRFYINTPVGALKVWAKSDWGAEAKEDNYADFPGVYVDLVRKGEPDVCLACIEWESAEKQLQTCVYQPEEQDTPNETFTYDVELSWYMAMIEGNSDNEYDIFPTSQEAINGFLKWSYIEGNPKVLEIWHCNEDESATRS